jgi:hypothetical protein
MITNEAKISANGIDIKAINIAIKTITNAKIIHNGTVKSVNSFNKVSI